MEWLIFVGLGIWVWRQQSRISALLQRVNALELRVEAARVQAAAAPAPSAPAGTRTTRPRGHTISMAAGWATTC